MTVRTSISLLLLLLAFSNCSKERKSQKAGNKMQNFIIDISKYARGIDSDFIIIPQNGVELLYQDLDDSEEYDARVLSSIDGYGVEELFFNGEAITADERLQPLLDNKSTLKVMVADYTSNAANYNLSKTYCNDAGFIAFPRDSSNYDYEKIPSDISNENSNDILKLSDAKNYLYLISTSKFATKTAFMDAIKATNYDVVLIDAFFGDELFTSTEIASLKAKANGGKRLVISYINIGAAEKFRYYWQADWKLKKPNWLYKPYDGYEDEIWVKFWKKDWQEIIYGNDHSYMKKILDSGFDGAYLDNVEAYYFLYFE